MSGGYLRSTADRMTQFLRLAFLRSPNFVTGTSGWTINQDGSAEFNNVIIRGGEIVDGTFLLYSGPPAAGNLIASITATAITDAQGNLTLPGVVSYFQSGGIYIAVQIYQGVLAFWHAATEAGPWTQASSLAGLANGNVTLLGGGITDLLTSGISGPGGLELARYAAPSLAGVQTPAISTLGGPLLLDAGMPVYASDPALGTGNAETWHTITGFNSGWAATAGGVTPAYRFGPDGLVEFKGEVTFTSTASSQSITSPNAFTGASLPAAYRPAVAQNVWAYLTGGTMPSIAISAARVPLVQAGTGGVLTLFFATAGPSTGAGQTFAFGFKGRYPLTN